MENFLYGEDDASFADTDSFLELGLIDSTGVLELVAFVEERYDIQIEDSEMIPENLDSVERVAAFVDGKMEGT